MLLSFNHSFELISEINRIKEEISQNLVYLNEIEKVVSECSNNNDIKSVNLSFEFLNSSGESLSDGLEVSSLIGNHIKSNFLETLTTIKQEKTSLITSLKQELSAKTQELEQSLV